MNKAIFSNQAQAVAQFLEGAQTELCIAVCWFSHSWLFSILQKKAAAGCTIRLMVQFDQANFHPKGLGFSTLKGKNVAVRVYRNGGLMHHKFAVKDGQEVLTGSFNWTRTQHADHLLVCADGSLAAKFTAEFEQLWAQGEPLELLAKEVPSPPAFHTLFEPIVWSIVDLRQAVIRGAQVWLSVFKAQETDIWYECLRQQRHLLRAKSNFFEGTRGTWSAQSFVEWLPNCSQIQQNLFKNYCLKMRSGDVLLAAREDGLLLAIGLVGVHLEATPWPHYGFARYVQWFEFPPNTRSTEPFRSTVFGRFRGSGLQVISLL